MLTPTEIVIGFLVIACAVTVGAGVLLWWFERRVREAMEEDLRKGRGFLYMYQGGEPR